MKKFLIAVMKKLGVEFFWSRDWPEEDGVYSYLFAETKHNSFQILRVKQSGEVRFS